MTAWIKAGLLGGIVLFVWGYVSWMMLPWHAMTHHSFQSDVAVAQAIQANVPVSGVYVMPSMQTGNATNGAQATSAAGPMIFAAVVLEGAPTSMVMPLSISLLSQIIAAMLVAWMLSKTVKLSFLGKVKFVLVVALVAIFIKDVPMWNWAGFDTQFTLVAIGDTLIGWLLASIVLAKLTK
jgi:hypothetical protein